MKQRQLGKSGLVVSPLALGTRTWGLDTEIFQAAGMLQAFQEAGGTVIDVEADPGYPEPLDTLAELLASADFSRDDFVILLRTGNFPGHGLDAEAGFGPTRAGILDDLAHATRTLNSGHIDLLMIQGPREQVNLGEIISAARAAYLSGAARYLALSDLSWWDGGAIAGLADSAGFTVSAWGGELSLLKPVLAASPGQQLAENGLGIVAGAPLAQGILTGKYRSSTPADSRATTPRFGPSIRRRLTARNNGIVEALVRAADGLDRSPAQVALAWTMQVSAVATTVIGPRTEAQLVHLLEAANWTLPRTIHDALRDVALARD